MPSIFKNNNEEIARLATSECLQELFEVQAEAHPDAIALCCDGQEMTYGELETKANQLAHLLRSQGFGKGQLIGILLDRSFDEFIAFLAILKTGAAYVPLDPHYPTDRINYILSDANVNLLITHQRLDDVHQNIVCQTFLFEEYRNDIAKQPITKFNRKQIGLSSNDLCYIIYTSGTTGRPKGVAVEHQSVCNFIRGANSVYGVTAQDRVYQGFSFAFDAASEEIWMAFFNGATLVVATSDEVRSGATLTQFLQQEKITVLSCVPTLLSMISNDVPSLRLLISGGETLSQDLYDRWAKNGLKIFNTYGPTESTIVATYMLCSSEQPVTIGLPLPNYEIYILDSANNPVDIGVTGELYIGGIGLARGYVNKPELTEQKFINASIKNGTNSRLYRTGDLACVTPEGYIQFMGRADNQIKLRGFRIELSEIESAILQCPNIDKVIVTARQIVANLPTLIAYVVPKKATTVDVSQIISTLRVQLPNYMIPSFIEVVTNLPRLHSGKIDQSQLPLPHVEQNISKKTYVAPRSELEQQITQIWEHFFNISPISIKDDFFYDLGGHSLFVTKIVSELRKLAEMKHISMLDIYNNPTIEKLAEKFKSIQETQEAVSHEISHLHFNRSTWRYRLCGIGQAIGVYLGYFLSSAQFLFLYLSFVYLIDHFPLTSIKLYLIAVLVLIVLHPVLFTIVIAAKWLILGRAKPGNYRLWGGYYFRWWLTQLIQKLAPADLLMGSPLMNLYCRLMGAKVGRNAYIGTDAITLFDMLQVGDESSINGGATVLGYTVDHGWLKIGPIQIGKRCYIGTSSDLGIYTKIGDDAVLDDQSMLPAGSSIPAEQHYTGSPARPGQIKMPKLPDENKNLLLVNSSFRTFKYGILHYLSLLVLLLVNTIALMPGIIAIYSLYQREPLFAALLITPLAALAYISLLCFSVVIIRKLVLSNAKPGLYKLQSGYYIRRWLISGLMLLCNDNLSSIYGTIFSGTWLRIFGTKVGKRVEASTLLSFAPDLLKIGDESFIADSVFVCIPKVFRNYALFSTCDIDKRTFVGNCAVLPNGTKLPESCLIGVLSVPPVNNTIKPGSAWFGSPAVFLPQREVSTEFSETLRFSPTRSLFLKRIIIDFLRIISPMTFFFISLAIMYFAIDFLLDQYGLLKLFLIFPLVSLGIGISIMLIITGLKWLIIGRYRNASKPLWSMAVWSSELITGLYENIGRNILLNNLVGSPFIVWFLRLLGMKIGKHAFINSGEFTEFDLIEIGDDVTLNYNATIQTHLFEDRVMKMAKLKVGNNCSIGTMAVVLFDTVMEQGSSLANLSLLMKGEILPRNTAWEGIPAQAALRELVVNPKTETELNTTPNSTVTQIKWAGN